MLNWLFKRRGSAAARPGAPPAPAAAAPAPPPEDRGAQWRARLDSARGDDARLLEVARGASTLDIKLAAVDALVGEDALRIAEREFRRHDRRVHRLAKQRLDGAVAAREARARAEALIDGATALAGEAVLPLNRLAQLDRDWRSLAAGQLDAGQAERFAAARERLDALMRERDARRQHERRWIDDARTALADLQCGLADAAARGGAGDVDALVQTALSLRACRPDAAPTAAADQALQAWLDLAAQVQARLRIVAERGGEAARAAPEPETGAAASAAERWRALPALADATLARLLDERIASAAPAESPVTPRPLRPARTKVAADAQVRTRIEELLTQAEDVLASGQLGAMPAQLAAIDAAFDALDRAAPALRERRQALNAEFGRLRSWQQWGGARAVDTLVEDAEALAAATAAATDPEAVNPPALNLDAHAAAIRDLRARWKTLEQQHAPAGTAAWRRFDAAVQAAYAPIAARNEAQKAERRANLAAREALLDALDAQPLQPGEGVGAAEHWRARIRILDRFRADWRALGPPEQRVPREALAPLRQRLRDSVGRIETPLRQARAEAEAARAALIASAQALAQELPASDASGPGAAGRGNDPPWRDATARARALQDEWARQARELPLAHAVETALWTRFRAAIDSIYAQRQAAAQAADAELAGQLAAREALIARLASARADASAAELRRTLAEVDALWRQQAELPRAAAAAIEARYDAARAAVRGLIAGSAQRRWQAQVDALAAKLSWCEARESGSGDGGALDQRWAEAGALPPAWEDALARRWAGPDAAAALSTAQIDERLLRLESALDLPSPPAVQEARRELKLRAMKDALEGRAGAAPEAVERSGWLAELIGESGANASQRERLRAIVAALRQMPAAALGTAAGRD